MIDLRPPRPGDEKQVGLLLRQLGYDVSGEEVQARLSELAGRRSDPVLLAVDGSQVLGLVALHWTTMLQAPNPVARITTLVVRDKARGQGIGRRLVEAASVLARQAGCGVLELTTALHRADAHAFYRSIGFEASSLRLHRALNSGAETPSRAAVEETLMTNLFDDLPAASQEEVVTDLLARDGARIERIVSTGQSTPLEAPYDQDHDEWVLLLRGAAGLWIDGEAERTLRPGDHILIPARRLHRVTWTAQQEPTVWLAVHFASSSSPSS